MKKQFAVYGLGGILLALCGCGPELAQINYGTEEAEWTRGIQNSYRGYRPPRTAPPAIEDNVSPRLVEAEENETRAADANEVAIPEAVDENAVPAPAADETAGEKTDEKAAGKSGDPAEVKTDESAAGKAEAAPDAEKLEFTVYTVKAGDTLAKIAKEQYGDARKYDVIVKANGIADPSKVRIGTKLQIPKL